MLCAKCGKEINENDLVCGYCGHAVPKNELSVQKQKELEQNIRTDESLKPNHNLGVRTLGIVLMIVSGIMDIVSIAMVGSGSFGSFSTVLVIGSVTFFVGLLLTLVFR